MSTYLLTYLGFFNGCGLHETDLKLLYSSLYRRQQPLANSLRADPQDTALLYRSADLHTAADTSLSDLQQQTRGPERRVTCSLTTEVCSARQHAYNHGKVSVPAGAVSVLVSAGQCWSLGGRGQEEEVR